MFFDSLPHGSLEYRNYANFMENEKLTYVKGFDPDNDTKFEYISFGIEFTLLENGNFTLDLGCFFGYMGDEDGFGGSMKLYDIDDDLGYIEKGVHKYDYSILTSHFKGYTYTNFTLFSMRLDNGTHNDQVDDARKLGHKYFDLVQIDFSDPYEIYVMKFNFFNTTDPYGFESVEFNFTAFFKFEIVIKICLKIEYPSNYQFSYSEDLILHINGSQMYTYYLSTDLTESGWVTILKVRHEFNLLDANDNLLETVRDTAYYQEPQPTNTSTIP